MKNNAEFILGDASLFQYESTRLHHMNNTEFTTAEQTKEFKMIEHLDGAIVGAIERKSKLPLSMTDYSTLPSSPLPISKQLRGFSGICFRHLMNNLCAFPNGINYLEVGVFKGSTLISAVYGNEDCLTEIHAIDNFSEFLTLPNVPGPKETLEKNLEMFLPSTKEKVHLHEIDCFQFDLSKLPKIDIYFYDGEHSTESQYRAFKYYEPVFADIFIAVIDDWEQESVRLGTRRAFEEIGYDVIASRAIIPGNRPGNINRINNPCFYWWSGTYLAVLRKRAS